jgi:hypothetical protein
MDRVQDNKCRIRQELGRFRLPLLRLPLLECDIAWVLEPGCHAVVRINMEDFVCKKKD